ncbi:FMN-binding protein [Agromyces kandeliae]|uniref:FMN-binding protein n=1 Tax=Agromyces kandeliae TaxID=2666141 RepID=UPI002D2184C4|nr:FMN-binding protein [Agromyces kandeliae]
MRTRALLLASAASAAAIIGGWQLGTAATDSLTTAGGSTTTDGSAATDGSTGSSATGSTGDSGTSGSDASAGSSATDAAASSGAATSTSGATDGTYAGTTVSTRFGDAQVQVTISGGAITDVTALQLPDHDGRSVQISNRAASVLQSEVLQAQSSSVSMVSGATYTSSAYLQSLQAALDAAGF